MDLVQLPAIPFHEYLVVDSNELVSGKLKIALEVVVAIVVPSIRLYVVLGARTHPTCSEAPFVVQLLLVHAMRVEAVISAL